MLLCVCVFLDAKLRLQINVIVVVEAALLLYGLERLLDLVFILLKDALHGCVAVIL